jgi:hypothetical protein
VQVRHDHSSGVYMPQSLCSTVCACAVLLKNMSNGNLRFFEALLEHPRVDLRIQYQTRGESCGFAVASACLFMYAFTMQSVKFCSLPWSLLLRNCLGEYRSIMAVIKSIFARQIFDSRGNPTVEVSCCSKSCSRNAALHSQSGL